MVEENGDLELCRNARAQARKVFRDEPQEAALTFMRVLLRSGTENRTRLGSSECSRLEQFCIRYTDLTARTGDIEMLTFLLDHVFPEMSPKLNG